MTRSIRNSPIEDTLVGHAPPAGHDRTPVYLTQTGGRAVVSAYVDLETCELIDVLAEQRGVSRSTLSRWMLLNQLRLLTLTEVGDMDLQRSRSHHQKRNYRTPQQVVLANPKPAKRQRPARTPQKARPGRRTRAA